MAPPNCWYNTLYPMKIIIIFVFNATIELLVNIPRRRLIFVLYVFFHLPISISGETTTHSSMTVGTFNICRWVITIALTLFHCSVTFLIFYLRTIKRHNMYQSAFYLLYVMISVSDIATIIVNFCNSKVVLIDEWKPWFVANPIWIAIGWLLSGYLIYFQSIMHVSIALNRAWIAFDMQKKNIEIFEKMAKIGLFLLPVIPLGILSVRFAGTTVYKFDENGEIFAVYVQPYVASYHSTAGPAVVLSSASISFVFAMITIFRYRYLYKQYSTMSSSMKRDILLFAQAIVILFFQFALAAYYIMRLFGPAAITSFALKYFEYIIDIGSLVNPFAMLAISKSVRSDYFNFFTKKQLVNMTTTSKVIDLTTTKGARRPMK